MPQGASEPHAKNPVNGAPMFVHDFVAVPLPVDETVLSFTTCVPAHVMAELVRSAWNADAPILVSASTSSLQEISAHTVNLELSRHRLRHDAAIIGLQWRGDGWLPSLDADLELVAFGHECTHLHLMGRYELPHWVDRFSTEGSLIQRVMVVVVRTFLSDLSDVITRTPCP